MKLGKKGEASIGLPMEEMGKIIYLLLAFIALLAIIILFFGPSLSKSLHNIATTIGLG